MKLCAIQIPYGYTADEAEAAIAIDDVIDEKCRLMDCQVSQFYEWLAWEQKIQIDSVAINWEEKQAYLNTKKNKRNK